MAPTNARSRNGSATLDPELNAAPITLRRLEDALIEVAIVGLSPVIPHRWSEKALGLMRAKQFGTGVRAAREPKNPEEEAAAATYWLPDGRPGMPATAFKAALVDACRFFDGLPMTAARQIVHVDGEGPDQLVPIAGTLSMREDTPRNSTGVVDLRYRNQINDWSAVLRIRFVPSRIDANSVVALVDAAGRGGVGDWRPSSPKSKTGTFGTWRVSSEEA